MIKYMNFVTCNVSLNRLSLACFVCLWCVWASISLRGNGRRWRSRIRAGMRQLARRRNDVITHATELQQHRRI